MTPLRKRMIEDLQIKDKNVNYAATGDLDSDTGYPSYCQEGFFLQTG
jgi:hypothetical protein